MRGWLEEGREGGGGGGGGEEKMGRRGEERGVKGREDGERSGIVLQYLNSRGGGGICATVFYRFVIYHEEGKQVIALEILYVHV